MLDLKTRLCQLRRERRRQQLERALTTWLIQFGEATSSFNKAITDFAEFKISGEDDLDSEVILGEEVWHAELELQRLLDTVPEFGHCAHLDRPLAQISQKEEGIKRAVNRRCMPRRLV